MAKLKKLSEQAVPAAIKRAAYYRLLNEPMQSESICRDVLRVDPDNQEALTTLLLAQTDQFVGRLAKVFTAAEETLQRLGGEYQKAYYGGLICERRGNAHLERGGIGSGSVAYDWYRKAMDLYETAEQHRPADNDDAILRWNTCERILRRPEVQPRPEDDFQPLLE